MSKVTHYTIVTSNGDVEAKYPFEAGRENFSTVTEKARKLVKASGCPRWVVAHSGDKALNARKIEMASTGSGRTTSHNCGPHRVPKAE